MNKFLKSNAWIAVSHGVVFLILGYNLLTSKPTSLQAPLTLFSFMVLGLGVLIVIFAIARKPYQQNWWHILVLGLLDLVLSLLILFNTEQTSNMYIKMIAIFAFVTGASLAWVAFKSEKFKVLIYVNAGISLAFGLLLFFNPQLGSLDLLPMVGLYTVILGIFFCYAGWWMYNRKVELADVPNSKQGLNENQQDGNY